MYGMLDCSFREGDLGFWVIDPKSELKEELMIFLMKVLTTSGQNWDRLKFPMCFVKMGNK